jgi:penicillin G amidase
VRLRRVLAVVLVVVLVVVGVGVGSLAWLTGRALPQTSGTLEVPGLVSSVTVIRDLAGIAHIRASNVHDLFMAQGFVHAQERMWQMEVWRHISAGRLSEMFGESQLDVDRFVRTLGWRQAAERDLAAVTPEARTMLDAYAQGVNAWLDQERDSLGLAFVITGAQPEPWTPLDTLAWQKVQAWNSGGNFEEELFRYLADAHLGDPKRTDELFPPYRDGAPVISPSEDSTVLKGHGRPADPAMAAAVAPKAAVAAWHELAGLSESISALAGFGAGDRFVGGHGVGSNNWVVSPSLTTTGGAFLATDPHLGSSMPSIWFMNGLHCTTVGEACPFDVAGVSFPGAPGVALGHNARIAWGATNLGPDVQDLFIERADPDDPAAYLLDGVSTPFEERVEEIRTKGGPTYYQTVRSTIHGPVLNDVDGRLEDQPLMSLAWTAIRDADRTFEAILGLNKASNFDEFQESLSLYGAPSQNFVYADVDGHIGYQFPGAVPIRDGDPTGDRPRPGDDGSSEWAGMIPYEELPSQLDPVDGTIVTANNAAVDASFPYHVASNWDPGYRAERIADQLLARGEDGLSFEDMNDLQLDTALPRAQDAASWLLTMEPATDDGRLVLEQILEWDGRCDVDSVGCAAWSMFEYRLHRDLFDDELGSLARDYVGSRIAWVVVNELVDEPESAWWDDVSTPERESSASIITRALDEAGGALRISYGAPGGWTWGRLHTATFREQTLGTSGIGPLEWYFNDGPHAVAGAGGAINATDYRSRRAYPDPLDPAYVPVGVDRLFEMANMPSMRFVIDMSDLDGARIVITTGQSGNPFDHHYNDLIEPWRTGETVPLPFTPAAIDAAASQTLTLQP